MVMTFNDMGEMAVFWTTRYEVLKVELEHGLEVCSQVIEATAKSEFGVYQPGVDSFAAWPELAEYTKQDRVDKGFTPNDPLLRTGALRDSIEHEVEDFEAVIGSKNEIMSYQELGTANIPPRPVLGPALIRNEHIIQTIIGHAAVTGICGDHAPMQTGYVRQIED